MCKINYFFNSVRNRITLLGFLIGLFDSINYPLSCCSKTKYFTGMIIYLCIFVFMYFFYRDCILKYYY